jgi:hypothetical protein
MKLQQLNEQLNLTTTEKAVANNFFGPVYHGSSSDNLAEIRKNGFKVIRGERGEAGIRHGYLVGDYGNTGKHPPIHHLGFGVYFTTVKSIAKKFNNDTTRGLVSFYLDVPRLKIINFASSNTMMKWWMDNGYNPTKTGRMEATENLTRELSSKYDAVWFKGKTIYKTLDGDQICVYDPSRIYMVDDKNVGGYSLGAMVRHSGEDRRHRGDQYFIPDIGVKGKIISKHEIPERFNSSLLDPNIDKHWIVVKWSKGGTHYNYTEGDLIPLNK